MLTKRRFKSWARAWFPFGLRKIDWYFIRFYIRTFILILVALAALVAIGDMFQRFDDFVLLARRENQTLEEGVMTFLKYYGSWVPQLLLQYMLPIAMLLAAAITITSSFAGPRGNNEYIVLRSSGVSVLRAFFPLLFPALLIAVCFQATRDRFLPTMVRESQGIINRLKSRTSNPTSLTHFGNYGFQTAAIGWFAPDAVAHNLILEVRDPVAFQRGEASQGDNDFVAFRAASAILEPAPGTDHYQWRPLEKAKVHTYTRFTRRENDWTDPVPTDMTPAMIERQPLGDAVSSWHDLRLLEVDNPGARFEMHWRLAEPIACVLLIIWGAGICMSRMLGGKGASYIQSISICMLAAAFFYILRLAGKSLWESGYLWPEEGVWLPLVVAAVVAVPIAVWIDK